MAGFAAVDGDITGPRVEAIPGAAGSAPPAAAAFQGEGGRRPVAAGSRRRANVFGVEGVPARVPLPAAPAALRHDLPRS